MKKPWEKADVEPIGSLELTLSELLLIFIPLTAFVGLPLAMAVAAKPRLFWPTLIMASILGAGPKIIGYAILDEFLVGFIVAGAFVGIALRKHTPDPRGRPALAHIVYPVWLAYLAIQVAVGIAQTSDFRMVRWIILFAALGAVWWIAQSRRDELPFPAGSEAVRIVAGCSLIYFALYLAQGMAADLLFGTEGRFLTQDFYWSGPAVAVFPGVLALPAAFWLLGQRSRGSVVAALSLIMAVIGVAFFFDSRALWLTVAGFLILSWWKVAAGPALAICAGFLLLARIAFADDFNERSVTFIDELLGTAEILFNPRENDAYSRVLQLRAGLNAATSDVRTFWVGQGFYAHREEIVPHVRELLMEYPARGDYTSVAIIAGREAEIIRTVGFSALLIDTGMVGLVLLLTCVGLSLRQVWAIRSRERWALLAVIGLGSTWLLWANVLDVVLWYLLVAPLGWAEGGMRAQSVIRNSGGFGDVDRANVLTRGPVTT